jgi:hypothetical protein
VSGLDRRDVPRQWREPVWMHEGCGGPVYFEIAGGFCWQCGAGRLRRYEGDRYVHQDAYVKAGTP